MKLRFLKYLYYQIQTIVPVFYGISFILVFNWIYGYQAYRAIQPEQALWPTHLFLILFSPEQFYHFILWFLIFSLSLSLYLWRYRFLRISSFLAIFLCLAAKFSFGKINHSEHIYIFISFFFIFLPRHSRLEGLGKKLDTLFTYHSTLLFILFIYSLSGFWKLSSGINGIIRGDIHFLHPLGLALHVAKRSLQTNVEPLYSQFVIDNLWLGPILLTTAVVLEFFAFPLAIFKFQYIKYLGLAFIGLHLGSFLLLGVSFSPWIIPFALLFFSISAPVPTQFKFISLRKFWRYKSMKAFKLLCFILLTHSSISFFLYFYRPATSEVFPISTWSLFTRPPHSVIDSDYQFIARDRHGNIIDVVNDDTSLKISKIEKYSLVQKIGKKIKNGEKIASFKQLVNSIIPPESRSYTILERKYHLIKRYRSGQIDSTQIIFQKTLGSHNL